MTLPTPDAQHAQPSRLLPRKQLILAPTHSMPDSSPPVPSPSSTPAPAEPEWHSLDAHEHALDFATHSWDLATGGLKTLTAKRELPVRSDRRSATPDNTPGATSPVHSYTFALIILTCIVLMLIGTGVVLFILLQP